MFDSHESVCIYWKFISNEWQILLKKYSFHSLSQETAFTPIIIAGQYTYEYVLKQLLYRFVAKAHEWRAFNS